jgi:hypothetical protein
MSSAEDEKPNIKYRVFERESEDAPPQLVNGRTTFFRHET